MRSMSCSFTARRIASGYSLILRSDEMATLITCVREGRGKGGGERGLGEAGGWRSAGLASVERA